MNLYIPQKLKVGFQNRKDTFTGKLAYIVYYDHNNVLRKEKSWNQWKDDDINSIELDNTPRSGYIINKGVQRDGYWGSGRSVIRVYDPRDFEFEIDVTNLVGILMHSDVSKCDISEECVFAWNGNKLVLLPVNSQEYQNGLMHTDKQKQSIAIKDLVPGYQYTKKASDDILTYIGYYKWYEWKYFGDSQIHTTKGKKHIFHDGKTYVIPTITSLSSVLNEEVVDNFAELLIAFENSHYGAQIIGFDVNTSFEKEKLNSHRKFYKKINNYTYVQISCSPYYPNYVDKTYYYSLSYTRLTKYSFNKNIKRGDDNFYYGMRNSTEYQELHNVINTLGFDPKKLTKDQFYSVLINEQYGTLQYILENNTITEAYTNDY